MKYLANPGIRTTLLFALVCWIWGSTWLAIKFGLVGVPPFVGAAIRMAISGVLLVAVATLMRAPWPRGRIYVVHVLTQGVLVFGFQYALVYWSELTVPSGLVAVLFAVNPLLTAFLAAFVFRIETLALVNVVGLITSFCGLGLIFSTEVFAAAHASAAGALAVLGASSLAAIATVFAKRYAQGIPPIATVGPGQIVGALVLGALALFMERGQPVHFTTTALVALLYLTFFGSTIAFLTYFTLIRVMTVTKLSLLTYITPVIAVLLGFVFAQERLAPLSFAGIAVVFIGITLVHFKPRTRYISLGPAR